MTICDETLERAFLGEPLGVDAEEHVRRCARCGAEIAIVMDLGRAIAGEELPGPSPELRRRLLAAASPHLARNRRRATGRLVSRALAAALLPLPLVLLVDAWVLGEMHRLLSIVLPPTLSFCLVASQAGLIALLLAIAYGAIPVLVERQQVRQHA